MKTQFKKGFNNSLYRSVSILVAAVLLVAVFLGAKKTEKYSDEQNLEIIEQSIREAIACCYSIEGVYPPDIEYIEDNYGLFINHDKFLVDYDIFASNIMPDVVVIDKSVFD